jgi:hypothetical protein
VEEDITVEEKGESVEAVGEEEVEVTHPPLKTIQHIIKKVTKRTTKTNSFFFFFDFSNK